MEYPDWVIKHKVKGTELRKNGKNYYLYKISSKWNKKKKRAQKITEKFLGKITEAGLITPKYDRLQDSLQNISVKEFGASHFIANESADIIQNLKEIFPECWKEIYTFSVFRFFFSSTLKNVQDHYLSSHMSDLVKDAKVSPKALSILLHTIGRQRGLIKNFLSRYITSGENMAIDITHVFSLSENVISSTIGRNSMEDYTPQISFLLLFSLDNAQPTFYRILPGSVVDVSSLTTTMDEAEIKDIILVGDKGFHSADNIDKLDEKKIRYVLPIKRNSSLIDYSAAMQSGKRSFGGHFLFENRIIWFSEKQSDGRRIVTFLDDKLKSEESRDFLIRVNDKKAKLEEFHQNEHRFGTITIVTKTNISPQKIFELLKCRIEIETVFDTFKNVLNADRSYMRDDIAMEGWMFVNFLALLLYYKVYSALMKRDILNKYSPRDVVLHLSRISKLMIGENWKLAEIPKKSRLLTEKLEIQVHIT